MPPAETCHSYSNHFLTASEGEFGLALRSDVAPDHESCGAERSGCARGDPARPAEREDGNAAREAQCGGVELAGRRPVSGVQGSASSWQMTKPFLRGLLT